MADRLTELALNEVRALQREIQGLKNFNAALERRVRYLEGNAQVTHGNAQTVTHDEVTHEFPKHVPGTTGRGIQYELSDGTKINAGKVKALKAEAALHG